MVAINHLGRAVEFDDYLDELYPLVWIGEVSMLASNVLYYTDRIAYDVMLSDWEAEQEDDDDDVEPLVCSAEDAWDSLDTQARQYWARHGGKPSFVSDYNFENNL